MSCKNWMLRASAVSMLCGAVGCDYFDDVTVPATDTEKPVPYLAVWQDNVHEKIWANPSVPIWPTYYNIAFDEYYVLLGAGIDAGGTKKVTFEHGYTASCMQGEFYAEGYTVSQTLTPVVSTQPGGVGQTVSNGWYTGASVRLSDYAVACPAGYSPDVVYRFRVTAEDFHANKITFGWAQVRGGP